MRPLVTISHLVILKSCSLGKYNDKEKDKDNDTDI